MGCTPSIQVNQTDVVYRRDCNDSSSPLASQSATLISGLAVRRSDRSEVSHSSDSEKLKRKNKNKHLEIQTRTKKEKVRQFI